MNVLIVDDDKKFIDTLKKRINKSTKKYKVNCNIDIKGTIVPKDDINDNYNLIFISQKYSKKEMYNLIDKYDNTNTTVIMIGDLEYQSYTYNISKKYFERDYPICELFIKKYYEDHCMITIPRIGEELVINANSIIYIEIKGHNLHIYTNSNSYICYIPIQEFVERINYKKIIQIHRSFVVNMDYIYSKNKERIVLENGIELTIGRKYLDDFDKAFNDYLYNEVLIFDK